MNKAGGFLNISTFHWELSSVRGEMRGCSIQAKVQAITVYSYVRIVLPGDLTLITTEFFEFLGIFIESFFVQTTKQKGKTEYLFFIQGVLLSWVFMDEKAESSPSPSITNPNSLIKNPKSLQDLKPIDKRKIRAIYSTEEVAKHNTKEDCWLIIKGNVYDVTPYLSFHPGGQRSIMTFAGKDGTDNVQFHSSLMLKLLDTYFYIGTLPRDQKPALCIIS